MIVVVGESLLDIVPEGSHDAEHVGGGPLNIAVGLARLDQSALLITQVGHDARADAVLEHLRANEVEVVASPTHSGRTNTARATLNTNGEAHYEFDLEWTLPHQELPRCDVLHVGSLGTALEPGRASVMDLVDQAWGRDVVISFDPNLRPQFMESAEQAWRDIETIGERATLIKMSAEDVALVHPGADYGDIARASLTGERTELLVITDGAKGATAYSQGVETHCPTPKVDVVDTVGAGDSFMSAMLAILMEQGALTAYGAGLPTSTEGLNQVIAGAAAAAAITCSRAGANPPRLKDLPKHWPA